MIRELICQAEEYISWEVEGNDQIWRVAISFVNNTNVVKLPNPRNSIHNALRSENLSPERKKPPEAQRWQNGQDHGRVALPY